MKWRFESFGEEGRNCSAIMPISLPVNHLQQGGWAKSLYICRAGRHSYGTENVMWAGWQSWKKMDQLWANFESCFCVFSWTKKNLFLFKDCRVFTKKLHNISFTIFSKFVLNLFLLNCVLLYWRLLPARLLYNEFGLEYEKLGCIYLLGKGSNFLSHGLQYVSKYRHSSTYAVFWDSEKQCKSKIVLLEEWFSTKTPKWGSQLLQSPLF